MTRICASPSIGGRATSRPRPGPNATAAASSRRWPSSTRAGRPPKPSGRRRSPPSREEIRNARRITAATALALLLALGFVIYALIQNARTNRQNREVRSRQLALLAAEREDDDHELALLLAIEAGHAALTAEAENVLSRQVRHAGRTVGLLAGQGDDLVRVGLQPGGRSPPGGRPRRPRRASSIPAGPPSRPAGSPATTPPSGRPRSAPTAAGW